MVGGEKAKVEVAAAAANEEAAKTAVIADAASKMQVRLSLAPSRSRSLALSLARSLSRSLARSRSLSIALSNPPRGACGPTASGTLFHSLIPAFPHPLNP